MQKHYSIKTLVAITTAIAFALPAAIWYFRAPAELVSNVPQFHGKTEVSVIETLGPPDQKYEFTMDKAVGEFRVELYNTYPPGSPGNKNVSIREYTWEYANYKLTLWLHQPNQTWVVFDSCRYKNGVMF